MEGITIIKSNKPGPSLAIMACVHGNEKVGLLAMKEIGDTIKIESGTLYLIIANPLAVAQDKRYIKVDMNRSFFLKPENDSIEGKRASFIANLLMKVDALMDIHAFNDKTGEPFIISDKRSLPLAREIDVEIISGGWDEIHSGSSDNFMHKQGKIAVCLECGPINQASAYKDLATDSIHRFLKYFGVSNYSFETRKRQKMILIDRAVYRKTQRVTFLKEFKNFEELAPGQVFAIDGEEKLIAGENEFILFPRSEAEKEIALIGKLDNHFL